MQTYDRFRAMDTDVDVTVEAEGFVADALLSVRLLFEEQEAIFSRFRQTSLLSALNRGEVVRDARFADACRLAIEAFEFTRGIFNPMVLPALAAAGYDRTFAEVTGGSLRPQPVPDPRDSLVIEGDTVRLRSGALDLGGIVKGWTVDLAAGLLAERGLPALVNAGGDLRAVGDEEGEGGGWLVEVAGPGGAVAWSGPCAGAMATSTIARRRWRTNDGSEAHHLIDPRTGLPAQSPFVQVTVRGELTWRAEAWAKSILIAGEDLVPAALDDGYAVLALCADGSPRSRGWEK